MPLFPTMPATLYRRTGTDRYGTDTYGSPNLTSCSVVRFDVEAAKTSVRTDSSASRGNAREIEAAIRLLFPPFVTIAVGDRVDIRDQSLRIVSAHPRFDITGKLDHTETDCEVI